MRASRQFTFIAIALAAFGVPRRPGQPMTKPSPPAVAPKEPAPPPSVTVIGARDAHGVLGRDVRSPRTRTWDASST